MYGGTIALQYPGADMNPDDNGDGGGDNDNKFKVGKSFFRDVFEKLTKDQRSQIAEDFKAFEREEQARLAQGKLTSEQLENSPHFQKSSTEVLMAESPPQAYQAAVAQDQEVQLLGAAQMVNEIMLESRAVKNDDTMMQSQLQVQKNLQDMVKNSLKKHEGLRNEPTNRMTDAERQKLFSVDASQPNLPNAASFQDKLQQYNKN